MPPTPKSNREKALDKLGNTAVKYNEGKTIQARLELGRAVTFAMLDVADAIREHTRYIKEQEVRVSGDEPRIVIK